MKRFVFFENLSFFRFFRPQDARNPQGFAKICYCIIAKCNGMSCRMLTWRILASFCQFLPFLKKRKAKIFNFCLLSHFSGFVASRVRKPPLGFDHKLLEFFWSLNNFQLFNITSLGKFLIKLAIFFLKICHFLGFSNLKSHGASSRF